MNGDIDCISRSQVRYFFEEATAGASLVRNKWAAVAFFSFLFLFVVVFTKLCGCEKMRGLIKTLTRKRLLIFSLQHMIDVKCN